MSDRLAEIEALRDALHDIPDDIEVPVAAGLARSLIGSLERIRRDEGKVCSTYEICHHGSCHSSYSSWAIADATLAGRS